MVETLLHKSTFNLYIYSIFKVSVWQILYTFAGLTSSCTWSSWVIFNLSPLPSTTTASSISVRDQPLSSMDCLSQDVPLQSSFHDTATERNKDLNQSEDEPVTSL